jgi:hypothetical protein
MVLGEVDFLQTDPVGPFTLVQAALVQVLRARSELRCAHVVGK